MRRTDELILNFEEMNLLLNNLYKRGKIYP
jgi:hypothetical protein